MTIINVASYFASYGVNCIEANTRSNGFAPGSPPFGRALAKQVRATHIRHKSFILNNKVSPAVGVYNPHGCTSIIADENGDAVRRNRVGSRGSLPGLTPVVLSLSFPSSSPILDLSRVIRHAGFRAPDVSIAQISVPFLKSGGFAEASPGFKSQSRQFAKRGEERGRKAGELNLHISSCPFRFLIRYHRVLYSQNEPAQMLGRRFR